ncbi:MAG: 2Fe-2S iron-sulfur cluster binding domain-containing protein [Bacteroidia bacterium]|nr:2Fe-2S iron-sulfur cluster binding domain-containing protein [Bacteroidia bacterium]
MSTNLNLHKVTFLFENNPQKTIEVQAVTGETLLDISKENEIGLHHNCGGVCACTTCHVYIESGMENISEMSAREEDYVDSALDPRLESRLACQCEISGDVVVTIPDQSRLSE